MAEKRAPAQAVAIDLAVPCAAWRRVLPRAGELAITAARAALTKAGARLRRAELSLVLADDATVAALNERWRHRSGPTNVLAFPGGGRSNAAAPLLLCDVILAFETVARDVREALVMHVGKSSPSSGCGLRLVPAVASTICPDRSPW